MSLSCVYGVNVTLWDVLILFGKMYGGLQPTVLNCIIIIIIGTYIAPFPKPCSQGLNIVGYCMHVYTTMDISCL